MANNIYRFRRIKWGDPAEKFRGLPGSARQGRRIDRDHVGIGICLLTLAIILYFIF